MRKIFVPIKKESQRVPNKNYRIFDGKPLWEHLILKFTENYVVYVDTDDPELWTILKDYKNVHSILRKPNLIGHDISMNKLLLNFVKGCCESDDVVAQIHTTSPFLKYETIDKMFDKFDEDSELDSLATVDVIQARCWSGYSDRLIPINHDPNILEQTQDLNPIYVENSLVYMFRSAKFEKFENRICGKRSFIPTSFPENLDIDTEADWELCQKILHVEKINE